MSLRILTDLHHGGLFHSLILLLERRLGHTVLRQIGMDWFTEGIWLIGNPYAEPRITADQYLGLDHKVWTAFQSLNADYRLEDGIYNVYDPTHDMHHKAITLEQFKEMDIDIILSTYGPHDVTFAKLVEDFKPTAKHVAQLGNIGQTTRVKNVMCSNGIPRIEGTNWIDYHQEFDLNTFYPVQPQYHNRITSFVIGIPLPNVYEHYRDAMPDYEFKAYGGEAPDGNITFMTDIASIMRDSSFGWHVKPRGDGFGHVLHSWYACGRPVITFFHDYAPYSGYKLLEDGVTAIDLDNKKPEQVIEEIRHFSEPERHKQMCDNAYGRFKEVVDFQRDSVNVQSFLGNLI